MHAPHHKTSRTNHYPTYLQPTVGGLQRAYQTPTLLSPVLATRQRRMECRATLKTDEWVLRWRTSTNFHADYHLRLDLHDHQASLTYLLTYFPIPATYLDNSHYLLVTNRPAKRIESLYPVVSIFIVIFSYFHVLLLPSLVPESPLSRGIFE